MSRDYRSEPMDSREGSGRARRAWDAVPGTAKLDGPALNVPVVSAVARGRVEEALGFWLLWRIHGGFDGLERFGMHRATIFRKIGHFRQAFGEHPDTFELPGIAVDVVAYWAGAAQAEQRRADVVAKQAKQAR